jgi:S1-C subfamily serine protease
MELFKSRGFVLETSLYIIAVVAVTFASGSIYGQEKTPNLTPAQIAEIAIPSVVVIKTPIGLGSGFVAAQEGKIVTNFHVIRGVSQATIVTSDRVEHKDVEVIALDEAHDLAVLRISASGLKPLSLADSSLSKPGEHVVAIGNPLGLGVTISDGLLSGIREFPQATFLQISAPISRGSSGGPVLNDFCSMDVRRRNCKPLSVRFRVRSMSAPRSITKVISRRAIGSMRERQWRCNEQWRSVQAQNKL